LPRFDFLKARAPSARDQYRKSSPQSDVFNMRQSADRNPSNEIGQFIDKPFVDRYPERILRKQITVSHENAALPHEANCCAESCPLLCVWR
jgi:hypothetical protein